MKWPRRKRDPIRNRERELNSRLASLQRKIRELESEVDHSEPAKTPGVASPNSRSTPRVQGKGTPFNPGSNPAPSSGFNDLAFPGGKAVSLRERIVRPFQAPVSNNPRFVTYLAAGGIHGLRPLRYERRIARNRFLLMFSILVVTLWGIVWMLMRNG